jgi:JmjC domain, hydroxylase
MRSNTTRRKMSSGATAAVTPPALLKSASETVITESNVPTTTVSEQNTTTATNEVLVVSDPETMSPTHDSAIPSAAAVASSPSPRAQRRDVRDGEHYVNRKGGATRMCKVYTPTLEDLQKLSFSEYMRKVVLQGARVAYEDDAQKNSQQQQNGDSRNNNNNDGTEKILYIEDIEEQNNLFPSKCPLYSEGMAKVTLPNGFWKEEGIGKDRTGRGPAWQKGTPLGNLMIPNPIKQNVRGIGGVYEYTLLDQPPIAVHELRDLADDYKKEQLVVGGKNSRGMASAEAQKKRASKRKDDEKKEIDEAKEEVENSDCQSNTNNEGTEEVIKKDEDNKEAPPSIDEMERKFWKRLGPTMPPPTYGADMEGSLFGDDPAHGWNLGKLDSFLQLLGPALPGVTSPYLYFGMWASVFAMHTEDMNLLSINYLHAGDPKVWYAVAPGTDSKRLEALAEHYFSHAYHDCKQFLRHKRCLLSPLILKKAGIKFTMQVQYPGEVMITMPSGYHFGFNTGFNVAEATNFGVPEWIPFGHEARICNCRPDSVRIDMFRLERLLARYHKENKRKTRGRRKSFRDWGLIQAGFKPNQKRVESDSETESEVEDEDNGDNIDNKAPKKPRMKDFWVEVMAPVPSSQRADYGRRVSNCSSKKPQPSKKRKGKGHIVERGEVWHLAKPMTRKGLAVNSKVLVMIPGIVASNEGEPCYGSDSSDSDESKAVEEEEQCFAGIITDFTDEHCRVHFASLSKDDDVWMHINSHKLFLDGGRWDDTNETKGLPPKHYWQEVDSKRRCV